MSILVENNLKNHEDKFEQRAHYIPCKIEEDGPANVKQYFEPYIMNENGGNIVKILYIMFIYLFPNFLKINNIS